MMTWLVAVFFVGNGIVNFFNPAPFRKDYERWQLPSWFYLFNGAFQLVTGVLLLFPATRWLGFLMGVLVCLGVFATLIRHREYSHLPPSVILFVLICLSIWGSAG
jgi:hypothetical protein